MRNGTADESSIVSWCLECYKWICREHVWQPEVWMDSEEAESMEKEGRNETEVE